MPFGGSLTHPEDASKIAKGFTNHEQTDPSGLIYMQARFYAPWFGRFLSPDPALDQHFEFTQSWNIYSYVQNNPTMLIDPTGMFGDEPGIFAALTKKVAETGAAIKAGIERSANFAAGVSDAASNAWTLGLSGALAPPPPGVASTSEYQAGRFVTDQGMMALGMVEAYLGTKGGEALSLAPSGQVAVAGQTLSAGMVIHGFGMSMTAANDALGSQGGSGSQPGEGGSGQPEVRYKDPKPGLSGKEGAKGAPSWAKGERPRVGESGKKFADRLMKKKYGEDWRKTEKMGPGSEHNKIRKWGDRNFQDPKP